MFLDLELLNAAVQGLGWALLHFLWQGAVVGAVFALGMLLLETARPGARYAFGLACMALLAIFPVLTFVAVYTHPGADQALASVSTAGSGSLAKALPGQAGWSQWLEQALPWVVAAWALGVAVQSMRVLLSWRRMRRLTRMGVRPLRPELAARVGALCELFGLKRAVRVVESTLVQVPTLLGWLKPVVLLPTATLIGLTPQQVELVIAHELGHVRRWDYIVNLLQVFVETALFYHPVVRLVSRRVREEREKCCDDLVLERCGNRLEYAKALTNLESMRAGDLRPALAATDGKLLERIQRIVHTSKAEPHEALAGNTLFIVLFGLTLVVAARLADPGAALEQQRSRLAGTLVDELLIAAAAADSQALLAPLENARFHFVEPARPSPVAAATQPEPLAQQPASVQQSVAEQRQPPAPVVSQPDRQPSSQPITRTSSTVSAAESPPSARPTATDAPADKLAALPIEPSPTASQIEPASLRSPPPASSESVRQEPVAVTRVAPEYPVRARMSGQTGYVEVAFAIGDDGQPQQIRVAESHPRRVFEKAAMNAIRKWRFDPATLPAAGSDRYTQRFDFELGGSGVSAAAESSETCQPKTGTRICRSDIPVL